VKKILGILSLAAAGGLAACDGNPLIPAAAVAPGAGGGAGGGTGGGVGGGSGLPPGTASPVATGAIFRMEDGSAAQTFVYDDANDEFTIDNLPFDGNDNLYVRVPGPGTAGNPVVTLDPNVALPHQFAVYDNDSGVNAYKLVYGVGTSTQTRFAIVRSPDYADYGFGGFVYERDGSVVIPQGGSADFTGEYAGIRNFDSQGGVQLVDGDILINVDFEDLNAGDAVQGFITGRNVYDPDTGNVLVANLPTLTLNTGSISDAGEISGTASSVDSGGDPFETGEYFGIISGTNADEIVGIVVVTSDNPATAGGKIQETGGFLANSP